MISSEAKNNSFNKNNDSIIELSLDCHRLSDGVVHREKIEVLEKNFDLSLEYLQGMIERELDIPRICQIDISVEEVKLNCSKSRSIIGLIRKLGTRGWDRVIPISLRYYAPCIKFSSLSQLVNRFDVALQNYNFRAVTHIINCIDYDFIYSDGWGSSRATGVRLYLANVGFMDKLVKFIRHVHQILLLALEDHKEGGTTGQLLDGVEREPRVSLSTLAQASQSLAATQDFLWNFGANLEDRLYQYHKGFLPLLLVTLKIVDQFKNCNDSELARVGDSLSTNAFGVFGGFAEIWHVAYELNCDPTFLLFLKKSLLRPLITYGYASSVSSYILFFLSSHCEISQNYISENIYNNVIVHFQMVHALPSSLFLAATRYCICLSLVNMLNTPGTWNSTQISDLILNIWEHFLKDTSPDFIAKFERENHFIWGTLEPFTTLFFSHRTSYLGFIQRMSTVPLSPKSRMVEIYLEIAYFSLEVVLRLDSNREQLLREKLFTHLIIANWRFGRIGQTLKKYYPSLAYFPVPSLYDISALTAIREGLGHSASFFHHQY